MRIRLLGLLCLILLTAACVRNRDDVVVVTATFPGASVVQPPVQGQSEAEVQAGLPPGVPQTAGAPMPQAPYTNPTSDPTRPAATEAAGNQQYIVQEGDTLFSIATANGISVASLLAANQLVNPDVLSVGQVLQLPGSPTSTTSDFKIMPDSRMIFGPGANAFDVGGFVSQQTGYIHDATDIIDGELLTAADVIKRVAYEYSVDPRVLLALLELKAGWLTNPTPSDDQKQFPMGVNDPNFIRTGLYKQLAYACDRMNTGYYGWKDRGLVTLEFGDGTRLNYASGLNAGTVGLQYFLSLNTTVDTWQQQIGQDGFYRTYNRYFGNPFIGAVDPVVPPDVQQPTLDFPFPAGQMWYFTGGPHGGYGEGSAWAAIDFAPPDDLTTVTSGCYVSQYYSTAVASGVIARTALGTVILDLDGDGDESTGWTILYLHIAAQDRIAAGTRVNAGDKIGHPSCEGGVSNGTHMHMARRYNGEWIPVTCDQCLPSQPRPAWVMSGWTMMGLPGQEYQGYMVKGSDQRVADQGRDNPANNILW